MTNNICIEALESARDDLFDKYFSIQREIDSIVNYYPNSYAYKPGLKPKFQKKVDALEEKQSEISKENALLREAINVLKKYYKEEK